MSSRTLFLYEELYEYMCKTSLRIPDVLKRLREETARDPMSRMQISPEQGQFMSLVIKLMNATKTLEIGVYTGYSSLCVALALPPEGKLLACDVHKGWTTVAKRYWAEAGVSQKIELNLAPALETMDRLLRDDQRESFDFVFIDADKENYEGYYERALRLVRKRGLIAVDNVFWSGRPADSAVIDSDTLAIRAFNEKLRSDERIDLSTLPIGDGLTLAMKR